jgi:hypothetical protein
MAKETKAPKDNEQKKREAALSPPPPAGQSLARSTQTEPISRRAAPAPREIVPGFENMDSSDLAKPRLAICQSMSPQRKKSDPKFIAGLDEGMFFNTVTNEIYGTEVTVVPLMFFKSRVFFNPLDEGGGMRCQSPDSQIGVGDPGGECAVCPHSRFGEHGEAPECTNFFNYAALVVPKAKGARIGPESLAIVSLKSTGLKVARDWNSKMRLRVDSSTRKQLPMFMGAYKLTSVEQKNDKGTWSTFKVDGAGTIEDKNNAQVAEEAYYSVRDLFTAGKLKVDLEDLAHETSETDASAGTGGM